jgi:hypothetical protein
MSRAVAFYRSEYRRLTVLAGYFPAELLRTMHRKLVVIDAPKCSKTSASRQAIALRNSIAIGLVSTVFASTINGASVFAGKMPVPTTLRSLTISEGVVFSPKRSQLNG